MGQSPFRKSSRSPSSLPSKIILCVSSYRPVPLSRQHQLCWAIIWAPHSLDPSPGHLRGHGLLPLVGTHQNGSSWCEGPWQKVEEGTWPSCLSCFSGAPCPWVASPACCLPLLAPDSSCCCLAMPGEGEGAAEHTQGRASRGCSLGTARQPGAHPGCRGSEQNTTHGHMGQSGWSKPRPP